MDLKDVIAGTGQKTAPQNLINPVKVSGQSRPPGFYRSIVLDFLSVGSALYLGYAYFGYLTSGSSPWLVLAAVLLFATLSVLQAFLTKQLARRILVLICEASALVFFFFYYDDIRATATAGIVALVFLAWGYLKSSSELRNSVEIAFFRSTHLLLTKFTTAVLLFMILVYAPQAQGQQVFVPRQSFATFFQWSSGLLGNFYPGVPLNGTFKDFSESLAKTELQSNPTFQNLSPQAQTTALEQAAGQVATSLAGTTGIKPKPTEPLSDVIYDYIVASLASLQNRFQDKFFIVWVIALFLILRTVGFVFVWVAQFVSLIFYEIMIASGFMHIAEATQTKEIVEY